MNDILKQRLVGALILLALGVVFWPIIFVEPGDQSAIEPNLIPPRPGIDVAPIEPPDTAGLRIAGDVAARLEQEQDPGLLQAPEPGAEAEPAAPVSPEPAAGKPSRTRSEPPEQPLLDADGLPVAWILQVASVSSAAKANELRDRLLELDQKAYVKKVERGERDLYRVYIGPKFEKARLQRVKAEIDGEFGVNSLITRYVP